VEGEEEEEEEAMNTSYQYRKVSFREKIFSLRNDYEKVVKLGENPYW